MLEDNSIAQDEFNIKKQEFDTLAFSKSKGKLIISLTVNMPIPPETYGFVLEADYRYVRRWATTGKAPKNRSYLSSILQIDGKIIREWVKHNEVHRRMVRNPEMLKFKPMMKYEEFYEQYLRVVG